MFILFFVSCWDDELRNAQISFVVAKLRSLELTRNNIWAIIISSTHLLEPPTPLRSARRPLWIHPSSFNLLLLADIYSLKRKQRNQLPEPRLMLSKSVKRLRMGAAHVCMDSLYLQCSITLLFPIGEIGGRETKSRNSLILPTAFDSCEWKGSLFLLLWDLFGV